MLLTSTRAPANYFCLHSFSKNFIIFLSFLTYKAMHAVGVSARFHPINFLTNELDFMGVGNIPK
jgi:hypothetical protein